jgi:ASC-1-like (ASCH) protein
VKVLYLPYEKQLGTQSAFRNAFYYLNKTNEISEFNIYPFLIRARELSSWEDMQRELIEVVQFHQPDFIFWEIHGAGYINKKTIEKIYSINKAVYICQWNGDIRSKPIPEMVALGKLIDVTYLSGSGQIEEYRNNGIKNVRFFPHFIDSFDRKEVDKPLPKERDYYVTMIASIVKPWRLVKPKVMPGQFERIRLAITLKKKFGKNFGLFGPNWHYYVKSPEGRLPFNKQFEVIRNSYCSIGTNNFNSISHYMSDRPFIAMATGVPHVNREIPGMADFFENGKHCLFFKNPKEGRKQVEKILENPQYYEKHTGKKGRELIFQKHTALNRVRLMINDYLTYKKQTKTEEIQFPDYDFFLDYKQTTLSK